MAMVSAYHSVDERDPRVYHDHDDCPSGQQITAVNWRPGTGGLPHCEHCAEMT